MEWKVTDLSIFWIGKTIKGTWFEPRLSHAQCRSRDNILENCFVQAQSTRIRIFLNPQLFLSGYGFRPHVSGESGIRIRNFFNPLSRVEIFGYAVKTEIVWTVNADIFIRWRNNIEPSSLPWILRSRWWPRRMICCQFSHRSPGYQSESRFGWTDKFDLNTHTRGRGNFWNRKKKKVAD